MEVFVRNAAKKRGFEATRHRSEAEKRAGRRWRLRSKWNAPHGGGIFWLLTLTPRGFWSVVWEIQFVSPYARMWAGRRGLAHGKDLEDVLERAVSVMDEMIRVFDAQQRLDATARESF